jgi:hypothetical protein
VKLWQMSVDRVVLSLWRRSSACFVDIGCRFSVFCLRFHAFASR